MNISGIFILFAHWSDCVGRNDKVFTFLYKIVMHKKMSHPYEIQNTYIYIIITYVWANGEANSGTFETTYGIVKLARCN